MNNESAYAKPEIWGGIECTINRTRNGYRDQLEETGHYSREGDVATLCSLGFTKFRYPVLWERHFPVEEKKSNWEWTARQLEVLREHNVEPIVGLLHHGSGPAHTDLLDPGFPEKLAAHAEEVARTFPWIRYYTPVNEPLTTARFSGLYGFWYPHEKSDAAFARMLINQVKGIVLCMKAIRGINPDAILIQTEDLSKTHSTPALADQARFENERRWLPLDLLTGRSVPDSFAWKFFTDNGISEDELEFFQENPCPPGIAGFNYYATSERYLDERLENYPVSTHGGNCFLSYADTEAVRTGHMQGITHLLTEAWHRYSIPLAITECYLNCTREQQMRWLYKHVDDAARLCKLQVPVKAVTAWALLGSVDWNGLICANTGHYEEGVFSVKDGRLRPTALFSMLKNLANGNDCFHPALDGRGWWESDTAKAFGRNSKIREGSKKILLILGDDTAAGRMLCQICNERKLVFTSLPSGYTGLYLEPAEAIRKYDAWAIINASRCMTAKECGLFCPGSSTGRTDNDDGGEDQLQNNIQLLHFVKINGEGPYSPKETAAHEDSRLAIFFGERQNPLPSPSLSLQNSAVRIIPVESMFSTASSMHELMNDSLDLLIDGVKGMRYVSGEGLIRTNTQHAQPQPDTGKLIYHDLTKIRTRISAWNYSSKAIQTQ